MKWPVDRWLAVAGLLILAACASTPPPRPAAGGTPPRPGAGAERRDDPVKVGAPYQVAGKWYYPGDFRDYDEVGIASWYGPGFNGKSTANGEAFDQEMLSAAHKTLPLPSYVEVTNLENGRRMVLRVNDRGPFIDTRIIDLSRKSAEMLDMQRAGKARVRVRRVYPAEEVRSALRRGVTPPVELAREAETVPTPPLPPATLASARPRPVTPPVAADLPGFTLPPGFGVRSSGPGADVAVVPVTSGATTLIQVAAVADRGRAEWLKSYAAGYGPSLIEPTGSGLFRVRIGPYNDPAVATEALAKLRAAGYQDAHMVSGPPRAGGRP